MQTKIRQITDSIHGTIYISELEHMMMTTPYFYRLNDVYQSSTVYMTYPSNRTKRYEHSLGTMELAGQMFYACGGTLIYLIQPIKKRRRHHHML